MNPKPHVSSLTLVCLLAPPLLLLLSCGPAKREAPADRTEVGSSRAALTAQKCKLPRLPGTDPNKSRWYDCSKPGPKPKAPPAVLQTQQAQYLAAWQQQSPSWSALSDQQREAKRRALKASIIGGK